MYSETKINAQYKTGSNNNLFHQCFFISNAISVSKTTSHTQWLLSFGKVVLLRKVVHHNVRDDQPQQKM